MLSRWNYVDVYCDIYYCKYRSFSVISYILACHQLFISTQTFGAGTIGEQTILSLAKIMELGDVHFGFILNLAVNKLITTKKRFFFFNR